MLTLYHLTLLLLGVTGGFAVVHLISVAVEVWMKSRPHEFDFQDVSLLMVRVCLHVASVVLWKTTQQTQWVHFLVVCPLLCLVMQEVSLPDSQVRPTVEGTC